MGWNIKGAKMSKNRDLYDFDFDTILKNDDVFIMFMNHMIDEYNFENMLFIVATELLTGISKMPLVISKNSSYLSFFLFIHVLI